MTPIYICLNGAPKGWARSRHNGKRHFNDPAYDAYKRSLRWLALDAMNRRSPLEGPIKVSVYAEFPIPASWPKWKRATAAAGALYHTAKIDADNLAKPIDAFNGVIWRDDAQVAELEVIKRYGPDPRVLFTIYELPDASMEAA